MTTAVRQGDLQLLGQLLQDRLHSELPQNPPILVQCVLQNGDLLVLGEHASSVNPDPQQTFRVLQQGVQARAAELMGELRLYLRVAGQRQPYAFHSFKSPAPGAAVPQVDDSVGATSGDRPAQGVVTDVNEDFWQATENTQKAVELAIAAFPAESFDPPSRPSDFSSPPAQSAGFPSRPMRSPLPISLIVPVSACISIAFVLFGAGYAMFRPCTIGSCKEIYTADQLSQEAAKNLQLAKSPHQIVEAQRQLVDAGALLKDIPPWSRHYESAQDLRETSQIQALRINVVLKAMDQGSLAAQKSQNPPHPVQVWKEVQSHWKSAIASLQDIPQASPVYPFAKVKLQEYGRNLAAVNRRLKFEEVSGKQLAEAKSAASVAEASSGVAQSLESWQKVDERWQKAISSLEALPTGTMAYKEAQQLLPSYRTLSKQARERKNQEQTSQSAYNQAIALGDQAWDFAQKNQWGVALAKWRQALNYAGQVPIGTIYYVKILPQIDEYKAGVQEAQAKLKTAANLKKTRTDLSKTCAGDPKVCEYKVNADLISVWLTAAYVEKVRETAFMADTSGDSKAKGDVNNHIQTLQTALEVISENASIPLQLYDPYGSLIGRHPPN